MFKNEEEAGEKIHELYLECQDAFCQGNMATNERVRFSDAEEDRFYNAVSFFFIQQRQKEIISRESYGRQVMGQIQEMFNDDKGWNSEEDMLADMADFRRSRQGI